MVLEDTVSLIEAAMQITSPIELRCTSPWLDSIVWTAQEDWSNFKGSALMADEEERCVWIVNANNSCYVLYPSLYWSVLAVRKGWEWFDPIREEARYRRYADRLKALAVTRPKNNT